MTLVISHYIFQQLSVFIATLPDRNKLRSGTWCPMFESRSDQTLARASQGCQKVSRCLSWSAYKAHIGEIGFCCITGAKIYLLSSVEYCYFVEKLWNVRQNFIVRLSDLRRKLLEILGREIPESSTLPCLLKSSNACKTPGHLHCRVLWYCYPSIATDSRST